MTRRFVLLDRDGTINAEAHYLSKPEQLVFVPGAVEGMRHMRRLGLGLVIVTNQSGVARGYFDQNGLTAIHEHLRRMLDAEGVTIDGIYVCPHGPEDDCTCRKPLPGMIDLAVAEHGFDPARSFMIGDKAADVDMGRCIGATTFLVRTGYGAEVERQGKARPDFVVDSLVEAAAIIDSELAIQSR